PGDSERFGQVGVPSAFPLSGSTVCSRQPAVPRNGEALHTRKTGADLPSLRAKRPVPVRWNVLSEPEASARDETAPPADASGSERNAEPTRSGCSGSRANSAAALTRR